MTKKDDAIAKILEYLEHIHDEDLLNNVIDYADMMRSKQWAKDNPEEYERMMKIVEDRRRQGLPVTGEDLIDDDEELIQ